MTNEPSRGVRMIVLGAITLGIVAALGAGAAQEKDKSNGLKFAVVDPGKVVDGYNATQEFNKEMKQKLDELQIRLQAWQKNSFLSPAEQTRLGDLQVKGDNTTPAEKAEVKKLTDENDQLTAEFQRLQGAATPSPTDKARMSDLIKLNGDTRARLETTSNQAQETLRKTQEDNGQKVLKDVRDGVAKVAKKEGYNVVFSSQAVWYADNDITDAVVKQVNSNKP